MADLDETVEAQGGVLLAHTALFAAVLDLMRGKGLITQAEVNTTLDNALLGVEASPVITPETTREARELLERFAQAIGGPRGSSE